MADIEMADTMVSDKAQSDSETARPAAEIAGADAPERAEPSSRCDYALFSASGSAYVAKIIIGKRRRALDPAKVDELATSIRQRGLLQAIVVTPAEPVEARLRGRKKGLCEPAAAGRRMASARGGEEAGVEGHSSYRDPGGTRSGMRALRNR